MQLIYILYILSIGLIEYNSEGGVTRWRLRRWRVQARVCASAKAPADSGKKSSASGPRKGTKKIKSNLEKTTLGDVADLATLKKEMENAQKQDKEKSSD